MTPAPWVTPPTHEELFQGLFFINLEEQCFFTHRVKSTLSGQTITMLFMLKVSCYKTLGKGTMFFKQQQVKPMWHVLCARHFFM